MKDQFGENIPKSFKPVCCDVSINRFKITIYLVTYVIVLICIWRYAKQTFIGEELGWNIGDWLINYEGGLIRRGLIGQLLYNLSGLGFPLVLITYSLQIAIFFLMIHYILKLFFSTQRSFSWLMLLFSPAFVLLFPLYEGFAGYRKEMLVFLSFSLLANGLLKELMNHKYIIASLFIYTVAVFSHELSSFCLVFFVYILWTSKQRYKYERLINIYIITYTLLAASGIVFSLVFPSNSDLMHKICNSLLAKNLNNSVCQGSISYLDKKIYFFLHEVINSLKLFLLVYPIVLVFALVPIWITDWWKKSTIILTLGFISFLPLFVFTIDWGRWIHIYVSMITIVVFLESCHFQVSIRKISSFWLLLFVCMWTLPHVLIPEKNYALNLKKNWYLALKDRVFNFPGWYTKFEKKFLYYSKSN